MTLYDYFKEYPEVVGKILKDRTKLDEYLKPLIEADELFYQGEVTGPNEKIVYVFLDGSRGIRGKRVNEDWFPSHPVMYIGKGTIDRPLHHFWGDSDKVNIRFRDWLDYMKKQDLPVYLMIYSHSMLESQATELEADLINLVETRVQSLNTGARVYSSRNAPIRMFNSKFETSNQRVYSLRGNRQRLPKAVTG